MEKKTALYGKHIQGGGKMVEFAGYLLPVQYQAGIIAEHKAVRERAGLFDVSHMGEFLLEGEHALAALNHLLTNDFTGMADGACRYSPMCYEDGGVVDDLLVYKFDGTKYLLVVNAANKDKDFEWMASNLPDGAGLKDISDSIAQLALQGPLAAEILGKLSGCLPGKYYTFIDSCMVAGVDCLVSRTGYTGEDGFEIYCDNGDAERLFDAIVEAGGDSLTLCGLGARDTLRLEAGMPLYGHELSADITPREAGLGFFVKMDKPGFIGKDALEPARTRKRVGLVLTGRGIAREGAKVFSGDEELGFVTSGTMSPTLNVAIAMAYIPASFDGAAVEVEVRGKRIPADVVKTQFYAPEKK